VDIVVPVAARADGARRLSQRAGAFDSLGSGSNVTVNGQGPGGTSPDGVPTVLAELVEPTAGFVLALRPDDSVSRLFKTMLDDFRATYVLQYVPRGVGTGGWHDVEIAVKKRGKFEIRARKGYQGRGTIPATEETP
jgi:hypothetical protein